MELFKMENSRTAHEERLKQYDPDTREGILAMHKSAVFQNPNWTLEQTIKMFFDYKETLRAEAKLENIKKLG